MLASITALVPFLAATAMAQTLTFYNDTDCSIININNMYEVACGYGCTNLDGKADKGVKSGALEPNQQVVLYTDKDCKGDAYAAIGDAYASTIKDNECAASECDGFGSFKVQVYDNEGGGEACPPGTLKEAPTAYPKPTSGSC